MATLTISRFSCFDTATIHLSEMTLLIGPQASGKSVVSKLLYFMNLIFSKMPLAAEELVPIEDFKAQLEEEFRVWFPWGAWGSKKFKIKFQAGPAEIVVARRRSNAGPSERVAITFSSYLDEQYGGLVEAFASAFPESRTSDDFDTSHRSWELEYKVRTNYERQLDRDLGEDYAANQLFVPAGRSFFTTVGKAMAVFEQGNVLDPVTRRFGRIFASQRDRGSARARALPDHPDDARQKVMRQLFGGSIRFARDTEYVETDDGRRLPFSILSSGQQELLPLWLALEPYSVNRVLPRQRPESALIYIEEPEAHLFPSAQSLLFDHLASLVANPRYRRSMIITTHSPYLLAKANNLILAGQVIDENKRLADRVGAIVPIASALPPNSTTAYAIVDRTIASILDDDGLVDGDYLDSVSGDISSVFLDLLRLKGEIT